MEGGYVLVRYVRSSIVIGGGAWDVTVERDAGSDDVVKVCEGAT